MSSTLYVDNLVEKTSGNGVHIPGHVIQAVQNTGTNGSTTTVTGAYVTTPYTGTITPKFTTSKILVTVSFSVLLRCGSGTYDSAAIGFSLLRGSTRIISTVNNPHEMFVSGPSNLLGNRQSISYLDSPSTISATTYSLEAWPRYANQTSEFDSRATTWSVTLQEIAQ